MTVVGPRYLSRLERTEDYIAKEMSISSSIYDAIQEVDDDGEPTGETRQEVNRNCNLLWSALKAQAGEFIKKQNAELFNTSLASLPTAVTTTAVTQVSTSTAPVQLTPAETILQGILSSPGSSAAHITAAEAHKGMTKGKGKGKGK